MPAPAIEVHARRGQPLGMPPARFLRDYWQKRPLLIRGAMPDFTPPLLPDELAGLACMDGALARIVRHTHLEPSFRGRSRLHREQNPESAVAALKKADSGSPLRDVRNDEKWKVTTGPFDDAIFAKLPNADWTLLVQDVDKWDAGTAALLESFAFIPSWRVDDVMISYAVAGGGVGAHVDQYDVFLLQGLGRRHWAIDARANPPRAFRDDVELKLLREFRASHAWDLEPGDMLYLPPGVPHDGVAVDECMTYSIGMRAPAAGELLFDFAAQLAETLPESRRFSDPDLAPARVPGEIDGAALRRARETLGPIAAALDDDAFADWFGCFITHYRSAQIAAPRKRALTPAALTQRLARSSIERNPWSRFAWHRRGHKARLYASGSAFDAPAAWAQMLASPTRVLDGARLLKLPQQAGGLALLAALVNAGHASLRRP